MSWKEKKQFRALHKREIFKEVVKKIPLLTLPDGFGVDPAKILPYVLELAMEERKRTRSNEKGDCFPGSSVLLLISADAKGISQKDDGRSPSRFLGKEPIFLLLADMRPNQNEPIFPSS